MSDAGTEVSQTQSLNPPESPHSGGEEGIGRSTWVPTAQAGPAEVWAEGGSTWKALAQ